MTAPDSVSAFLYFGYLPETSPDALSFLNGLQNGRAAEASFGRRHPDSLVRSGVKILKRVFRESLARDGSRQHLLPLSGGLDSRAILGGLLDNLDTGQVRTVTYGTPGTLDFEIGQRVARAAGVRSIAVDLSAEDWRWNGEEIAETAVRTRRPVWLFDAYVNHHIVEKHGTERVVWSGFMGEALSGAHLRDEDSATWKQAKSAFVKWNRFSDALELTPPGFVAADQLPDSPWLARAVLSYDDQLDFGIRQSSWIKQIVLRTGYDCRTPFLHPDWMAFILRVPRRYREKQWLYKEILRAAYPDLFALPTKTAAGLPLGTAPWRRAVRVALLRAAHLGERLLPCWRWGLHPSSKYVDFDQSLRQQEDLKAVVHASVESLSRRGIVDWVDIDSMWRRHQRDQGDYADALTLLASLEMNIAVGRIVL